MDPVPHSQYRPIRLQMNAVVNPQTVPFRRRLNLEKANWFSYAQHLVATIKYISPTAES